MLVARARWSNPSFRQRPHGHHSFPANAAPPRIPRLSHCSHAASEWQFDVSEDALAWLLPAIAERFQLVSTGQSKPAGDAEVPIAQPCKLAEC